MEIGIMPAKKCQRLLAAPKSQERSMEQFFISLQKDAALMIPWFCIPAIKNVAMKEFYKLVRDKIPEIIENNNETCKTRILSDEEYLFELNEKIQEELQEYLESGDIEELADLEEVLRAILNAKGCSYDDFEKIRMEKVEKRGAFKERIFLETTDEL